MFNVEANIFKTRRMSADQLLMNGQAIHLPKPVEKLKQAFLEFAKGLLLYLNKWSGNLKLNAALHPIWQSHLFQSVARQVIPLHFAQNLI